MSSPIKKASISTEQYIRNVDKELMLDLLLSSQYPYSKGLIKMIEPDGDIVTLHYPEAYQGLSHRPKTAFIIEGMENLSANIQDIVRRVSNKALHKGVVDCRCIIAKKDAPLIRPQSDSRGMWMLVLAGTKVINEGDKTHWLRENNSIMIPKDSECFATNREYSVVLEIDFRPFMADCLLKKE